MAGFLKPQAEPSTDEAEDTFARSLAGRRFDDPGPETDREILRRINTNDAIDTPED